jgi:hypothetical protein
MCLDLRIDQLTEMCLEKFVRSLLVRAHQTRIACHIGGEDRGETAFDGLLHSFLQQRRTLAEPQSLMPRKQRRSSSFRGQRPERAAHLRQNRPRPQINALQFSPLGLRRDPIFSRHVWRLCELAHTLRKKITAALAVMG